MQFHHTFLKLNGVTVSNSKEIEIHYKFTVFCLNVSYSKEIAVGLANMRHKPYPTALLHFVFIFLGKISEQGGKEELPYFALLITSSSISSSSTLSCFLMRMSRTISLQPE
jgi:hypothetical protein